MSEKLTDKDIATLRTLVPLHTLSKARFDELLTKVHLRTGTRGTVIFREGDVDHEHIYLLEGTLALMSGNKAVDKIAAGSDTTRFPVAHQLPRRYGTRAVTAVRLAQIDSRFVSDLLARNQRLDYQVDELEEDGQHGDWMAQLLQSRIMQQIPAANIQGVMMRVEHIEVEAGDVIIKQGDEGDAYFMLSQGRALVTRDLGDGDPPHEIAQLGPGAAFGEEALLSDNPRNSTITMLSNGLLVRLSKDDFLELIQRPLSRSYNLDEAQRLVVEQGAVWLDVRSQSDYEQGNLPGSINLPFEALRYQATSLGRDRQYIVCSGSGERAIAAAFLLTEQGYEVSVLEGGYAAIQVDAEGKEGADEADSVITTDSSLATDEIERERLRAQVEAAEQRAHEMEARLQALAGEKEAADERRQAQFQALKESIDTAKAKILHSEQERRELREIVTQTQGKDAKWQQRLSSMEREVIAERERAESASDSLQEIAQKLTVVMEERELERARHDQTSGELKEQLTEVQLELEDTTQELEALRQAMAETQALAEQLPDAQSLRDAEAAAGAAREQVVQLQAALDALKATTSSDTEAQAAALAQRDQQLAELQQAMEAERTESAVQLAQAVEAQTALGQARDDALAEAAAAAQALNDQQAGDQTVQQQLVEQQQAFETERAAQATQREQLEKELVALTQARDESLAKATAAAQVLNEQQSAGQADTAALQQQLTEQQQTFAAERIELTDKLAQLESERVALETARDVAEATVADTARQLEEQASAAAAAQQALEAERTASAEKLTQAVNEQYALIQARDEADAKATAARQQRAELQSAHQVELEALQQQLTEQLQTAEARVTELDGELERAGERHTKLTTEKDQVQRSNTSLTERVLALEQDLEQARGGRDEQLIELQRERDQAQSVLAEAEAKAQAATDALSRQQDELDTAKAALATSGATHAATEQQGLLAEAEKTLAARSDEITRLQQAVESATAAQAAAEQQLAAHYAQAGDALLEQTERDERIETLTASLEALEAQQAAADIMQTELAEAREALADAALASAALRAENAQLEAQQQAWSESSTALAELEQQLHDTEEKIDVLSEGLVSAQQAQAQAERARDAALDEAKACSADVEQLRTVMEEYVEQIQAARESGGGEDIAALRMELELVRQQAAEETTRLKQSTENTRGDDALDREALRQELTTLTQTLQERQRELQAADEQRLSLEESLEDANRQVDELRRTMDASKVETEEAEFQREEAEQARRQVEQTLRKYQEDAVEADALDLRDERLKPSRGALDMAGALGVLSFKSLLLGLVLGSGLLIGGLELLLWLGGKGELFALLFGGG